MDGAGNQLFTGAGFAEDQHGAVAWRHHLNLLEHVEHRFAAADYLAKLAVNVVQLFGQREILVHQTLFQTVYFLIGEGVIDGNGDALGNLLEQLQVGGAEHFFVALGKLKHAEHLVARHQRQQAQRLNFIVPHFKQLALVRGQFVLFVEIELEHLLALKHAFGQRAGFVHFALIVHRIVDVNIVRRVDVQLAFAVAAQHHADGVDIEVVVDLFGYRADQIVHVEARQHGVGDRHQNTEIIALAAQQIVIDVVSHPALDLFGDDGNNLGKGVQALVLFFAPRLVVLADKLAAAEDASLRRQRQQAVVAERRVKPAVGQLRPGFVKLAVAAVQGVGA